MIDIFRPISFSTETALNMAVFVGAVVLLASVFLIRLPLDPNNSEFWHHKGIVLKALGRTTEADACLCQSRRATRI